MNNPPPSNWWTANAPLVTTNAPGATTYTWSTGAWVHGGHGNAFFSAPTGRSITELEEYIKDLEWMLEELS